jgi:hypothetical protein
MIFNRHQFVQKAQYAQLQSAPTQQIPRTPSASDTSRSNSDTGTISGNAVVPEGRPWSEKAVQLFQLLAAPGLLGGWPLLKAGSRRLTIADERGANLENILKSQLSVHRSVLQKIDDRRKFLREYILCSEAERIIWTWDHRLNISKSNFIDYDDPTVDAYLQIEACVEEKARRAFPNLISLSEIHREGLPDFDLPEPQKIIVFQVPGLDEQELEFIHRSYVQSRNGRRFVNEAAMRCPLEVWQEAVAAQNDEADREADERDREDAERYLLDQIREEQKEARRTSVTVRFEDV